MRKAILAVLTFTVLLLTATPSFAANSPHSWIQNGWTVHLMDGSFPSTTQYFFNQAASYGTGSSTTSNPVHDGFAATPALVYTSEAQLASDITNHVIPDSTWPAGSYVVYDNEDWPATPTAEQQDPEYYMPLFGSTAHNAGFKVIETPARDLGLTDNTCPKQSGENLNDWYLRCNIAGYAAQNADGIVVQDQVNTTNVSTYDSLFSGAKSDAAATNAAAWVDSELSVNYGTASEQYAAGSSLGASNVHGFFYAGANDSISLQLENSTLNLFKNNGW